MQNDWWTRLAERTQQYADMVDMHAFYEALKGVYGPSHQIQAPLCTSDGSTLLTDKEAILHRWSEHFEGLFSDRCTVQESSLAKIPQVDVKLELDDPPTCEEIKLTRFNLLENISYTHARPMYPNDFGVIHMMFHSITQQYITYMQIMIFTQTAGQNFRRQYT